MHCSDSWYGTDGDDGSDSGRCRLTQAPSGALPHALQLRHRHQKGLLADFLVDHSAKHCASSSMTSNPAPSMAAEQKQVGACRGVSVRLGVKGVWGKGGGGGGMILCAAMQIGVPAHWHVMALTCQYVFTVSHVRLHMPKTG